MAQLLGKFVQIFECWFYLIKQVLMKQKRFKSKNILFI